MISQIFYVNWNVHVLFLGEFDLELGVDPWPSATSGPFQGDDVEGLWLCEESGGRGDIPGFHAVHQSLSPPQSQHHVSLGSATNIFSNFDCCF